jgi:hypothetical protein
LAGTNKRARIQTGEHLPMSRSTRAFFAFGFLSLRVRAATAQTAPVDFAELENTVAAELRENKTPGGGEALQRLISGEAWQG